jgi:hypothetical protein
VSKDENALRSYMSDKKLARSERDGESYAQMWEDIRWKERKLTSRTHRYSPVLIGPVAAREIMAGGKSVSPWVASSKRGDDEKNLHQNRWQG